MFQNNVLDLLEWRLYHENVIGYESSQLGYESSGYETSMGTKRLDTESTHQIIHGRLLFFVHTATHKYFML